MAADLHTAGTLEACRQNFAALERDAQGRHRARLSALRWWTESMHERLAGHFQRRLGLARFRECHGDLHCANVVQRDGELWAFDALEFDPALRWIDVASDLAFLTMDLQARDRADLRARALDGWLTVSGDFDALNVLALLRGLPGLRAGQGRPSRRAVNTYNHMQQADHARQRYLAAAARAAAPPRPALIVMTGLRDPARAGLPGNYWCASGPCACARTSSARGCMAWPQATSSGGSIYDQAGARAAPPTGRWRWQRPLCRQDSPR